MSHYQVDICHVQTSTLEVLSAKETLALLKRYQVNKDESIKEQIVMGNLKLVLSLVSRFKQDELDDLFQAGCIGLVKAVEQFDLNLNVMFSTYAVPLIIGEMKAYNRSKSLLHVSRYLRDLSYQIEKYKQNGGEDVQKHFQLTSYELYEIENLKQKPKSLYEPKEGQEYLMMVDVIEDQNSSMHKTSQRMILEDAFSSLSHQDQWLITQRYYYDKTQAEVAKELVLSQAQISRMEKRILAQMRDFFI